jgi:hypothetical protein
VNQKQKNLTENLTENHQVQTGKTPSLETIPEDKANWFDLMVLFLLYASYVGYVYYMVT